MTPVEPVKALRRAKSRPPQARTRILLVDDDERNLLALSEVLEELAEVVTATSGRDALRALLNGDFAVILLDVFMPGMDGYETAGIIRERNQTARIPIIFLSAVNKETEHLMRGYAMGAVDYVFKPVDPLVLQSKVSVFVDLYEMRQQVETKSLAEQQLRDANHHAEIERLRIVGELEESRSRQAAILDALPIALYEGSIGETGRLQRRFVGGDLFRLTGIELGAETDEQPDWEVRIHPDDAQRASAIDRDTPRLTLEYRWQSANGDTRHFLEQCVRSDAGAEERWVGTLIDVTTQKRLESQLLQAGKMDAIGQLTGGVAHDFNNLLAAVLGGIHILQQRVNFGEREQKIVDQMRHASEQGAELVRRMMAFARKQDLSPISVDPSRLCESVAGLVEHTLGGTIEIDWQCPRTRSNLFVDQSQLELALLNLILNARDAMPGGGKVTVSISERANDGDDPSLKLLSIRVSDEGTGIAEEHIDRVTDPFFTTKEAGKGTGLGLSMVVGFVEQSGGRLNIESRMGKGTSIELLLPATPHGVAALPIEPGRTLATPSPQRVLLVDDDDAVRIVIGEQLREFGMTVTLAENGAAAIELLEKGTQFDLMLTDFAMPGLSGLDTIRLAAKQAPRMRAALMTGFADEDSIAEALELVAVLRKPIHAAELGRLLADAAPVKDEARS